MPIGQFDPTGPKRQPPRDSGAIMRQARAAGAEPGAGIAALRGAQAQRAAAGPDPYSKGAPPTGLSKLPQAFSGGAFNMRPPPRSPGQFTMAKAPMSTGSAAPFAGPQANTGLQQLQARAPGMGRGTR